MSAIRPARGFCRAEFETRFLRAQREMSALGLDALLVTAPANFRYFTGFAMQFWESPTRPWFLILPASGAPIAVVPEIGAGELAKTWIEDIRAWPAPVPADDGTSLLTAALNSVPHKHGRIGAELGREMSLRMPVAQLREVESALRFHSIADGSPCLWSLRMIKTEAEIAHIHHICQVASRAYGRIPELINAGDTELEACLKMQMALLREGADQVPFLPGISGPGGVSQIVCGPGERRLASGDMFFMDTGAVFDGYFCDFDRVWSVGPPDNDLARAYALVWQATEAGIDVARPGATTDDLFAAMARVLGTGDSNVGRFGHGLGLQLTEPPSHMPGDGTVIAENMVLTIEPGFEYAPGKMIVHEENVVIRADGAELLTTRAPAEIPVI
ncbi:MAG: Xaa-Pro peptidase family protein [Pseudomonadota bacterium]